MSNGLELVAELEAELGIKLEPLSRQNVLNYIEPGYYIDQGRLIGLNLDEIKLKAFPKVLGKCSDLELLAARGNDIADLTSLHLPDALTQLYLNSNQIQDLTHLHLPDALTHLHLSNNQIQDLTPLHLPDALTELHLDNNQIQDLTPLHLPDALTLLVLANNQIQDLTPLHLPDALTLLVLANNQIQDLTPLHLPDALTHLHLSNNQIQDLTPLHLPDALTELHLDNNQIQDLTPLHLPDALTHLHLSSNQIQDLTPLHLPDALTHLYLHSNQIQDLTPLHLPDALTTLHLDNNQIQDLTPLHLPDALTYLYLHGNQIQDLTHLNLPEALTRIDLRANHIQILPRELRTFHLPFAWKDTLYLPNAINLYGNPLTFPPIEIMEQGDAAIRAFLRDASQTQPLNEVKAVLLGQGGAGKTSLVKRFQGIDHDPSEETTHGIRIEPWEFTHEEKEFKVRFWDFGGQDILHATHQFFLSERSLYILVLNARKDEEAEEWLKHAQTYGGDSPVIVVINQIDLNPGFDLDRKFLRERYPHIREFFKVSCTTEQGIDELIQRVIHELANLPLHEIQWPQTWLEVKQSLESQECPYLNEEQYRQQCIASGVTSKESEEALIKLLHDLGVSIHFNEFDLKDTYVLSPKWVTSAVYRNVTADRLAAKGGVLSINDIAQILEKPDPTTQSSDQENHYKFKRQEIRYIIDLMIQFELCYFLDQRRSKIMIPSLLPKTPPEYKLTDEDPLRFHIKYHFLPPAVMPRFIVKSEAHIDGKNRWRTGVILKHSSGARALIREDKEERRMLVEIHGGDKRSHLAVIRETFAAIHKGFQENEVKEWIACRCDVCRPSKDPYYYDITALIRLRLNGIEHVTCHKAYTMVDIDSILQHSVDLPIKKLLERLTEKHLETQGMIRDSQTTTAEKVITEAVKQWTGIDAGVVVKHALERLKKKK